MPSRRGPTLKLDKGRLGVLCLETTEWDPDRPDNRMSTRPLLALLERDEAVRSIYRDIATRAELGHYLERWRTTRRGNLRRYSFLYLPFHGSEHPGGIDVEDGEVTVAWIGNQLKGRCAGTQVHFSSCGTLDLDARRIDAFRTRIGAAVVTGYTEDVGWLDSAVVDLMLMSRLQRHRGRVDLALRGLRDDADALLNRLGFIVSPSTLQ
ncbi:MAG TPA: hypothetical protein VF781_11700 [Solirubrobacteraceae bacterium]